MSSGLNVSAGLLDHISQRLTCTQFAFGISAAFFHERLKHKVMPVPGVFFDFDRGKRRRGISKFKSWVRFSFGSPEDNVREGL